MRVYAMTFDDAQHKLDDIKQRNLCHWDASPIKGRRGGGARTVHVHELSVGRTSIPPNRKQKHLSFD